MISEARIEAAAQAMYYMYYIVDWNIEQKDIKDAWRNRAKVALEAAKKVD